MEIAIDKATLRTAMQYVRMHAKGKACARPKTAEKAAKASWSAKARRKRKLNRLARLRNSTDGENS